MATGLLLSWHPRSLRGCEYERNRLAPCELLGGALRATAIDGGLLGGGDAGGAAMAADREVGAEGTARGGVAVLLAVTVAGTTLDALMPHDDDSCWQGFL